MTSKKKSEQNDNSRAICYYRYSSHAQNDASIEQQRERAHKWAETHGFTIIKEYEDRAKSGTSDDRSGYKQMLAEIGKLRPAALILWKADRLGRDRFDVALARKTIREAGCRVRYVAEAVPDDDSPEASLMEGLLDSIAQFYSEQLSVNITRGMRHNAAHALYNGHAIFGYGVDDQKKYVIDEAQASVVRRIFHDYADGKRLQRIADELNAQGLRTNKGGKFNINGLRHMLHNESYLGVYKFDDIVIEGGMPAIIDKETFDRVQARFALNKRKGPQEAHELDEDEAPRYWLTGKLYCGECGCGMQGTHGTSHTAKKYYYYGCGSKLKRRGCKKRSVRKDSIEEAVIELLRRLLNDQEMLASLAIDVSTYYNESHRDAGYLEGLEAEKKDADRQIENIIDAIAKGAYSNALQDRLSELEARSSALTEAIEAEKVNAALTADEHSFQAYFKRFLNADLDDPAVRDEVFEYFIDKIFVYDDKLVFTGWFVDEMVYGAVDDYDWKFGDFDAGFTSGFDPFALGSTR